MALRTWMVGLTSAVVLCALGLAACGGDDSSTSGSGDDGGGGSSDAASGNDASSVTDSGGSFDAGPDATAETAACQTVWGTICGVYQKCGLPSWFCGPGPAACPASLFAGGASFTVTQAQACAAALSTVTCEDLEELVLGPEGNGNTLPLSAIAACQVPGTRGSGDSCEYSAQCASLVCTSPESNFSSLEQAQSTGLTGACGSCAPTFGPNDDCTGGIIIGPPVPFSPNPTVCPPGTACDGTTKRCRSVNPGDPCISGYCAYGSYCAENPDGGAPTCTKDPGATAACDDSTPCLDGYCKFGSAAHDDGGTCQPNVAAGGDCTETELASPQCALGTGCVPSLDGGPSSQCEPPPGDGQPCPDDNCAPGTFCDHRIVDAPTCRTLIATGQPCGTYPQTYSDGGATGGTTTTTCAGECSVDCSPLEDGGSFGTCIGGPFGGKTNETCGNAICTSCAPGSSCVSGKCAVATLHCD